MSMLFDRDIWQEILSAIRKNKLRSFLTAFGVGWGIFMLIIMLGSGKGLQNGVTSEFSGMATNSVYIWTQRTTIPYKGFPRNRFFHFENADIEAIRENVPGVKYLAPRNQMGGYRTKNLVTYKDRNGTFNIYGDYPEIIHIEYMKIVQGRFLNPIDLKDNRKVAVIGERSRDILFTQGEDPIGKSIMITGIPFTVVGVFTKPGSDDREESGTSIYIPFSTFQSAFNFRNFISWFSLTPHEGIDASEVEEQVITVLAGRHRIHPDDKNAFGHWNAEEEFKRMSGLFLAINILIWIVGTGTLMAGVIGISNIMLVVVKERTREIGIRRALGATPVNIIFQVMLEAVVLTLVAGYSGLVIGVAALEGVSALLASSGEAGPMFSNPGIDFNTALQALGILVVSGLLAGYVPARRAVSIKPVDALRAD